MGRSRKSHKKAKKAQSVKGATPSKPSLLAGPEIIEIEDSSPEGYKPELAPPPPEVVDCQYRYNMSRT